MIIPTLLIIFAQCFAQNHKYLPTNIESTYFQDGKKISDSLKSIQVSIKDTEFYYRLVDKIGPVLIPDSTFRHLKKADEQIIYDAQYVLGPFGNRSSPLKAKNPSKHLIIAGDSNTFGDGNNLENTFVYLLAKDLKKYQVYNLGHRGGGPNNTLALMQFFDVQNYVKESEGLFIFNLFTDIVLERIVGSKNHACWDRGKSPYYSLENNSLVYKGNFKDRFFIHRFYSFVCENQKLNDLIKNLPRINDSHYELLAQILKAIQNEYNKKWPKGKFLVIVNHAFENSYLPMNKLIIPWLEKFDIPYTELPSISYVINRTFPYDQHLNANGQKEQYQLFKKVIKDFDTNL